MRRSYLFACALMGFSVLVAACGSSDGDDESDGLDVALQIAVGDVIESITIEETDGADDGTAPEVPFAEACQKSDEKQFAEAPPQIIDTGKTYVATISTAKGDIVVELFSDTPITTNNFVFLACKGFYDGLTFHRVEPDFVIQGGDPTGTGGGGPGYTIPDEDDGEHVMDVGVISMAKAGADTTGSQFFITIGLSAGGDLSYLDPDFTVFGRVRGQ